MNVASASRSWIAGPRRDPPNNATCPSRAPLPANFDHVLAGTRLFAPPEHARAPLRGWTTAPGRGHVSGWTARLWNPAVANPQGDPGAAVLQGWTVIAIALGYIGLLFVVASYGDKVRVLGREGRSRLLIYPLSLAIYCTSWTFFGSVGLASRTGYDFLAIYVGPVLMIGLAWPLLMRIVRLAKTQNITSIADFIAARYGKHQGVAAIVALIAIVGTIPYIALQLKAVSNSLGTILGPLAHGPEIIQ